MRKRTKVWLITAGSLFLAGCVLFTVAMSTFKWDFKKLSTVEYKTNINEISKVFNNISINSDTADIVFSVSDDGKCRVECYEDESEKHSVTVENNTLTVKINRKKSWYDHIGFHFGSPKITVILPKAQYDALSISEHTGNVEIPKDLSFGCADISVSTGDVNFSANAEEAVKIQTSTGNIRVYDNSVGAINLSATTGKINVSGLNCDSDITVGVSTGKVYLTDIACDSVTSSGSTGNITFSNVIAAEKFSVKRNTGNVKFNGCDATEIYIKTNTGDVTGNLLSNKVFITDTNTGSVNVPETADGGKCKIKTSTGDISITVKKH